MAADFNDAKGDSEVTYEGFGVRAGGGVGHPRHYDAKI